MNLFNMTGDADTINSLRDMLKWWSERADQPPEEPGKDYELDMRPPVRFITHEPYSTYCIKKYSSDSYDLDGDTRAGQTYKVMVDGETRVPVSLFSWDPEGNSKQMIEFRGDEIMGTIKIALGDYETTPISLASGTLTEAYLTQKLEALPNIGKNNVKVSLWPGNWLIEFVGDLTGSTPDLFEIDIPEEAVFECSPYYTNWKDSGVDDYVNFPIPLAGTLDEDDNVVNDAVAAGSIGTAEFVPGPGLVVEAIQCRDYNGDGKPKL